MNKKGKSFAILLALCIVFTIALTGCSSSTDSSSAGTSSETTTSNSTATETSPETTTSNSTTSETLSAEETEETSDYPNESISVIIPYGAGGITDTLTRSLLGYAEEVDTEISFICENATGASGVVGMTKCALADPDGYTFGMVPAEICQLGNIASYNCAVSLDDFRYVTVISQIPMLLCVRTDSDYADIYDFVDKLSEDTKIGNSGTYGMGDLSFIAASQGWGKSGTGVPYEGVAPAITALVADDPEIDAAVVCSSATLDSQINAGNLKILCSFGASTSYDAPVVSQLDGDYAVDIDFTTWCVISVPDDTPDYEYNYLVNVFSQATQNEEWSAEMAQMFITTASISGADAQAYVESQFKYYKGLIAELGIS